MDLQKERESFEAYMAEKYKNLIDRRQCLNNGGGYMAWDMNVAWKVWQAAKAQAIPEGFVLVKMDDLELLRDLALEIKYASLNNDSDRIFSDIEDIQLSIERLIEAQEPAND